jgi:RND family efflux transporter MFP subunit
MTPFRRYRVPIVLAVMLAVIVLLVFFRLREQQARAVGRGPREVVVGVAPPEQRDLEVKLLYTGDILPDRQTPIFSKVSGYIRAINVDRGDFVKAGQLLVVVEPTEMENALDQQKAALASAQAALLVARTNLEGARANLLNQQANLTRAQAVLANDQRQADRMTELFAKGLVSAQDRDNARTTYESSAAGLKAQEAQVQVARSQIATSQSQVGLAESQVEQQQSGMRMAQMHVDDTRLTAPFSGYIAQRSLEIGAAVSNQAAATSNSSVAILVVQAIDSVKVQIEVPEREVPRVKAGNGVRLTTDAYPERIFSGAVARVVHTLDPRTRTMGIEIDVPNPGHLLKPGMYARVELLLEVIKGALTVPLESVGGVEGRASIMVVRDGKVAVQPVRVGVADGPRLQIVQGLAPTDQVIMQGRDLVRDGQAVRAVPAKSY